MDSPSWTDHAKDIVILLGALVIAGSRWLWSLLSKSHEEKDALIRVELSRIADNMERMSDDFSETHKTFKKDMYDFRIEVKQEVVMLRQDLNSVSVEVFRRLREIEEEQSEIRIACAATHSTGMSARNPGGRRITDRYMMTAAEELGKLFGGRRITDASVDDLLTENNHEK